MKMKININPLPNKNQIDKWMDKQVLEYIQKFIPAEKINIFQT